MQTKVKQIFLGCILLLLLGAPVATLLIDTDGTSFYEQRTLAALPERSIQALLDGSYFTDLDTYLSDRVAFREQMVAGYTWANLSLSRPVVNQVVVASDVLLAEHPYESTDLSALRTQAKTRMADYRSLQEFVESYGGYFCYVSLPTQRLYYADRYPDYLNSWTDELTAVRQGISDGIADYGVNVIQMYEVYDELGNPDYLYPQTDHHFTLDGAYLTYQTIVERINADTALGVPLLEPEDWNRYALPQTYLGSSNRKLYGLWEHSDVFEYLLPVEEIPFTRTNYGNPVASTVITLPEEDARWCEYGAFMGGDISETVIDTQRPELPSILVYGDSFTNAVESMIWTGFDQMYSLDFRYYNKMSLRDYILTVQPEVVVCIRDESAYLVDTQNGVTK